MCGQIYSALIKLLDGELVGYYMDAGKEWGLDLVYARLLTNV
jgi:hypothetical protein